MRQTLTAAALALIISTPVVADSEAKEMHDENCTRCHGTDVYTRDDRRVKDRAGVSKQVRRCTEMLGIQWFDDDIEAVANYLNSTYYKY